MEEIKNRPSSRVSTKNQITIPAAVLNASGIEPGDQVEIRADGAGRVSVIRRAEVVDRFAGSLTGFYKSGELEHLREEWD